MAKKNTSPYSLFGTISFFLLVFLFSLLYFYLQCPYPWSYLIAINLTTFFLYGYDKKAALSEWRRVPEAILHALTFLGGTPFAFLAQKLFHHKTIKGSFRIVFWLIFLIQIVIILWLLSL
ncbi:MAG: DUF1294 domain-containing protein [Candidatus Brocadiae bacterium]|nr:DUF1294 domain-containing protein [Candidatus Brocadiia bacterium]